jgi:3-phosphoshikimate 1-carboxyvinyltransferase
MPAIKISVPGSKSITNRALALAFFSDHKIVIKNAADCTDTEYFVKALKTLELKATQKKDQIEITSRKKPFDPSGKFNIYTHNAGTTTRFLTALCTLIGSQVTITGDARMQERPIEELTKALNKLGAKVSTKNGCPPVEIAAQKLKGGEVKIAGNISSQYISALLLTAPFTEKGATINIVQKLCSQPYIKSTIEVLKSFGIKLKNNKFIQFQIPGNQKVKIKEYTVEADASSASYPAAYAALHPKKSVLLSNISKKSIQGDIKFLKYLEKMGCKITEKKNGIQITGPKKLKSLGTVDMNETPDLVMTFAVLAAFTEGKTIIKNIANLRIKETDRLAALEHELNKLGVQAKAGKDFLEIHGTQKLNKNIQIHTYDDHRMAMCFAIIRDLTKGLKIENPECVSKSYTSFWSDLKKLEA